MSKVVGKVGDVAESIWDATVGAVFDKLMPDIDQPEQDKATLAKGLQKGIDKPRRITFGRDRIGGVIAHQATVERGDKEIIQLIVLINGAPIDALEGIYIANKPLSDYTAGTYDYVLADGRHTSAIQLAVQRMEGWTTQHIGHGQAHIYLEFENNRDEFPDGISDCEFLIRGARVWDPRDTSQNPDNASTWKWSQNAVLCTLHYVRFYGANHVPTNHLPLNWWKAAANVCDEQVPYTTASGQTKHEPRYTVNGTFSFTSKPLEVLQQLERSFAGKVFRQMGHWYVRVGAWYGNPSYTVTMADIRGDVKIKWHADLRSRANIVRAQFVDPNQQYERTDAPPIVADGYLNSDGQQLEQTLNLPFVRSSATAQRLAAIHLEQTRLGAIELPLRHVGLRAAVGRTIKVNIPEYHIHNKTYRVVERKFNIGGSVTIQCVEDSPGIWQDGMVPGVKDLTPNTNYVPGQLKPVEALTASLRSDGQYQLTWTHDTPDAVEHYLVDVYLLEPLDEEPEPDAELPLKREMSRVDRQRVNFPIALLRNLQVGEYIVKVSAVNVRGKSSVPNALEFAIDIPQSPQINVDVSDVSVTLSAVLNDDTLGTTVEWQWLGTEDDPTTSPIVTSNVYTKNGLTPRTTYQYQCRAINEIGASEWTIYSVTTESAVNHIPLSTLSFELEQSPSWTGLGTGWMPDTLVHTARVVLINKVTKEELAYQAFTVSLDDSNDALIFIELTDDRLNKTELPLELNIDENGTSSVTVTATHDSEISRQTFSVVGVGPKDLEEITERFEELDAIAESVLEQALNAEQIFDADLHSTLQLEQKTDTTNATINEFVAVQASENEAMALKVSTITSEVDANKAQIVDVSQTLATTEQALATKITQLTSTVDNNHAQLTTYYITRADAESAVSQAKTELQSQVDANLAYLNQTFYTSADTEEAIAAKVDVLRSEVDGNHAQITDNYYTKVAADEAIAAKVDVLRSEVDDNHAQITGNYYTKVAADEAIAAKVNVLRSEVDDTITGLDEVYFTRADEDSALSEFVRNVNVSTPSGTASVVSVMSAHANQLGELEARASLGVDINGYVTGLDITPGKMKFASNTFEWALGLDHSLRSTNGWLAGYKGSDYMWYITGTGAAQLSSMSAKYSISVGTETSYSSVGARIRAGYTGVNVNAERWSLYSESGEVGPHTSAHETLLPKALTPEPGDILCDDELMHIASISNAICTAKISSTPMDVTARGIYTRRYNLTDSQPAGLKGFEEWEQLAYLFDVACINAGGEGAMNVCGEGGDLQTGDLICSSSMLGKGMRQPTQSEERYTIAQVRHNVTFDSPDQVKLVAVIYKRG
ncbi:MULTISPECIES: hypothetical protein [Pseudoalteromonas]|uniref:Fibronectin type-III domain-containing protein n=1 Tax=Pseudoalteromonas amylolytica TaxID=1859457 RepID=A0A1S1MXG8_9GAMM|nr:MULTISPECIES: hypothetical protein [Pseudoalteromonas]OHU85535.1 hypothetical protein BFC16_19495 [Pseudoalteromonas sp. JW3]OHU91769.1 hypothetical protein BET10_08190 [Pseudoalteromonas amylolytica]